MVDDLHDAGHRLPGRSDWKRQIEDKGRERHCDQGAGEPQEGAPIDDPEKVSKTEWKGEMQEIERGGGDVVPAHLARMVEGPLQRQARHLAEADPPLERRDVMDRHAELATQSPQVLV